MLGKKPIVTALAIFGIAACLGGCPSTTGLDISPTAFSFDSDRTDSFTLSNPGGGTVTWQVVSKPDWISVSPSSGSLDLASQVVTVQARLTGLPAGSYSSKIAIGTSAGDRSIAVTAVVAAQPRLAVSPTALDFGGSAADLTCSIQNTGAGELDWAIGGTLSTGFSLDKISGKTGAGVSDTVTVSLDRTGLAPGPLTAQFTVLSNGGTQVVNITGLVQAIVLTPGSLTLGSGVSNGSFTIHNGGASAFAWSANTGSLPAWLRLNPSSGTVVAGANAAVSITIDLALLGAGISQANVNINSDGGMATLAVTVQGPAPVLAAAPLSLDFGNSQTSLTFNVQNAGTGTLNWTLANGTGTGAAWAAGAIPWLAVSPASGALSAGAVAVVTVLVDRTTVKPDAVNPYQATIRVSSADGGQAFVAVSQMTLPTALEAVPTSLNFGTSLTTIQLALWNGGVGTATWNIDTSSAPSWLKFTSVTRGSISGNATALVVASADRTGLVPTDIDYSWTFEITGTDETGAVLKPVSVTASINVARVPAISVDTGKSAAGVPNVDGSGVAFLPMGTDAATDTFIISNQGTGTLNWSISTSGFPGWLKSVGPVQGSLEPLQQVTVAVTVDRTGLAFGSLSFPLDIASNDPNKQDAIARVEIDVPKHIIISTQPALIDLGTYGISDTFQVANTGDVGSTLQYQIVSNKTWCFVYPQTGASTATGSDTQDWQSENVSIDRSQLDKSGDSATLTISAYETDALGNRVLLKDVAPVAFQVSVQAAALSFEAAVARTRIPSLVRFVLLMRDVTYRPIPLPLDLLKPIGDSFSIFEQDVAVERLEAGQFLTSGAALRTNVVILLDYSGSMYQAAQSVGDQTIAGAADPLQALYTECAGALIDSLAANFTIGLMEFHDRSQASRLVLGVDGGPMFTSDKAVLHQRLGSISITDHGATELLPAVEDAAQAMEFKDSGSMLIPFDDTDVRALICITDGRLTTPPGQIKDAVNFLAGVRARFFGIGWGNGVFDEPLTELASGTGGHYYPTAPEVAGTAADGSPILRPVVSALENWCATPVSACGMSVGTDLSSQVVFSYVTLTEASPVNVRIDAAFDNPNDDNSPCEADQGMISGPFEQDGLDFLSIVGDVRLGQISLHTTGIQGGNARVVVRAEYVPRNVDAVSFLITCANPFVVSLAPETNGGIVSDWTLADLGGGNYSLTQPPAGTPLQYGAFGELVRIDFTGIPAGTATFNMAFSVTSPIYDATNTQGKYFVCPDSIDVSTGDFVAPAFPTPGITFPGGGTGIDFGPAGLVSTFTLRNIGGSHLPTNVLLNWKESSTVMGITLKPTSGTLVSTHDLDTVTVTLDRSGAAGVVSGLIPLTFNFGNLGEADLTVNVPYAAVIQPPALTVTSAGFVAGTSTLDFGGIATTFTLSVANTGQSTLNWSIDVSGFPAWLAVSPPSGTASLGTASPVSVTVNRTGLASGNYVAPLPIASDGGNQLVTVNMVVP